MRRLELLGKSFEQLTVLEELGKRVLVSCSCGTVKTVLRSNLLAGYTQSCGCLQKQRTSQANQTHGYAGSGTYITWKAMKARCNNPMKDKYHRYGERGISYDPNWEEFEKFLTDMGERPEGTELDRINNNLDYCKTNCRWTTHKQNCNNRG